MLNENGGWKGEGRLDVQEEVVIVRMLLTFYGEIIRDKVSPKKFVNMTFERLHHIGNIWNEKAALLRQCTKL